MRAGSKFTSVGEEGTICIAEHLVALHHGFVFDQAQAVDFAFFRFAVVQHAVGPVFVAIVFEFGAESISAVAVGASFGKNFLLGQVDTDIIGFQFYRSIFKPCIAVEVHLFLLQVEPDGIGRFVVDRFVDTAGWLSGLCGIVR